MSPHPDAHLQRGQMKAELSQTAEVHTSRAIWTGLALLSVQGGALAWLTWWVYSWDVMEPVTYFVTYATSMGAFVYFVLTKKASKPKFQSAHSIVWSFFFPPCIVSFFQDYVYPDAKDRQFLNYFYKGASQKEFNVEKYNELKDELSQVCCRRDKRRHAVEQDAALS